MGISIEDIKNHTVVTIKESMKFALLAMAIFLLIGVPIAYIFIDILKMNEEISGIIVGIIAAIITVIVDHKKIHSLNKINDRRIDMWKKIKI